MNRRMNSTRIACLLILALISLCSAGGAAEKADRPGWKLTFQDEFDGQAMDTQKWNPNDPWGRERNHELQAYVTNAFEVKGGILRINADKRQAFYSGKHRAYTSGMVQTQGRFSK